MTVGQGPALPVTTHAWDGERLDAVTLDRDLSRGAELHARYLELHPEQKLAWLIPLALILWRILSWVRFGVDCPYADDWRALTERELGVAVADIGAGTTDLALYAEGSPFYTSVIPLGGVNVTNDIAIGLRTNLTAAEQLKMQFGSKGSSAASFDEEASVEIIDIVVQRGSEIKSYSDGISVFIRDPEMVKEMHALLKKYVRQGRSDGRR